MFLKRSAPPIRIRTARRAIVLAGCLAAVLVAPAAQAAPGIDVTPIVASGSQVALGDVAQGQLVLTNHSTAPEDGGYITVSELTLVPSCGAELADRNCVIAPGPDLGMITIGDSGEGSGACTGNSFSVTDTDPVSGKVSFTADFPVILGAAGPGATCSVPFTYTVNRFPAKDSAGEEDGLQTDLVAFTRASASWNGLQAADLGYATVTVVRDTPVVTVSVPPTIEVGAPLSAAVTLAGTHPDGTLTFELFGPADPDCAATPLYSSTTAVNGNATVQSPAVLASEAGTYRWRASYGGDEDNDPASSDCAVAEAATEVVAPEITSPGEPGEGGVELAPGERVRLDGFGLSRKTFARASTATALTATVAKATSRAKAKAAKGTTIRYTLSHPATVTILVQRVTSGRRSGTRCVKATKKLKRKKPCTRYVKVSTLTRVHETGGSKRVPFSGRAGKKALAVGNYRLRAVASAGEGTASAVRTAKFKIVKR
jgi:hypothetical protein